MPKTLARLSSFPLSALPYQINLPQRLHGRSNEWDLQKPKLDRCGADRDSEFAQFLDRLGEPLGFALGLRLTLSQRLFVFRQRSRLSGSLSLGFAVFNQPLADRGLILGLAVAGGSVIFQTPLLGCPLILFLARQSCKTVRFGSPFGRLEILGRKLRSGLLGSLFAGGANVSPGFFDGTGEQIVGMPDEFLRSAMTLVKLHEKLVTGALGLMTMAHLRIKGADQFKQVQGEILLRSLPQPSGPRRSLGGLFLHDPLPTCSRRAIGQWLSFGITEKRTYALLIEHRVGNLDGVPCCFRSLLSADNVHAAVFVAAEPRRDNILGDLIASPLVAHPANAAVMGRPVEPLPGRKAHGRFLEHPV